MRAPTFWPVPHVAETTFSPPGVAALVAALLSWQGPGPVRFLYSATSLTAANAGAPAGLADVLQSDSCLRASSLLWSTRNTRLPTEQTRTGACAPGSLGTAAVLSSKPPFRSCSQTVSTHSSLASRPVSTRAANGTHRSHDEGVGLVPSAAATPGDGASSSAAAGGSALGGRGGGAYQPGRHYDAVVVGLGAFGSSVLYHLARQGLKVLGIERHRPVGHSLGSSHGASRIIRLAYFEGLQYGPLLKRSYRLFQELEQELAERQPRGHGGTDPPRGPLFTRTGMLDVGAVFEAAHRSALVQGLQHEVLTGAELNRRFPAFRVPEHWRALFQPDGGVLAPERIVQAHVALAQQLGAEVVTGEGVAAWRAEGSGPGAPITLTTSVTEATAAAGAAAAGVAAPGAAGVAAAPAGGRGGGGGRTVSAAAVVMCPGPWIGQVVPELRDLCVPERQVVGWFDIEASARRHFSPDRLPVWVLREEGPGGEAFYGFPEHGQLPGFKIGLYHHLRQQIRDPDALDAVRRTADDADEAALRRGVVPYFPAAASGRLLSASACFFTNTPDGHFLIDRHPRYPQVVLCSACSGHGFKMSSGIGQLIARMVVEGTSTRGDATGHDASSAAAAADGAAAAAATGAGGGAVRRAPEGRGGERVCAADVEHANANTAGEAGGGSGGAAGRGVAELLPFRFDPTGRPGHAEALARFG